MSLVASALLPVIVPPHGIASAVAQVSLDGTAGVVTQIFNNNLGVNLLRIIKDLSSRMHQ